MLPVPLQALTRLGGINSQSAANTAAATTSAINLKTANIQGDVLVLMNAGALTGSITGGLEESADGSTDWQPITPKEGAFTQLSAAGQQKRCVDAKATRGFLRFVGTIVTGPCLLAVDVYALPKNT